MRIIPAGARPESRRAAIVCIAFAGLLGLLPLETPMLL
jgi:hypothetical protein